LDLYILLAELIKEKKIHPLMTLNVILKAPLNELISAGLQPKNAFAWCDTGVRLHKSGLYEEAYDFF
jgi:hypothetical protein